MGRAKEAVEGAEDLIEFFHALVDRSTEQTALLRGLSDNGILFTGIVPLAVSGSFLKGELHGFTVPFATLLVSDPMALGPIHVSTGQIDTSTVMTGGFGFSSSSGVGSYIVAKSAAPAAWPLSGRDIYFVAPNPGGVAVPWINVAAISAPIQRVSKGALG